MYSKINVPESFHRKSSKRTMPHSAPRHERSAQSYPRAVVKLLNKIILILVCTLYVIWIPNVFVVIALCTLNYYSSVIRTILRQSIRLIEVAVGLLSAACQQDTGRNPRKIAKSEYRIYTRKSSKKDWPYSKPEPRNPFRQEPFRFKDQHRSYILLFFGNLFPILYSATRRLVGFTRLKICTD